MLASFHLPPANPAPYLSFSCQYLLGAYKQRRFFLSNHCKKVEPYLLLPLQKQAKKRKGRKTSIIKLLVKIKMTIQFLKFQNSWLPWLGEERTLKKLLEASCQQIKRRLEMISAPFADVWSHGYLQDNQEYSSYVTRFSFLGECFGLHLAIFSFQCQMPWEAVTKAVQGVCVHPEQVKVLETQISEKERKRKSS